MESGYLEKKAIRAALAGDWTKAIKINQKIVKIEPGNLEALNRLGFAYLKNCEPARARGCYQRVLKIDPHHPIALKNLSRSSSKKKKENNKKNKKVQIETFLEESGKTKVVSLVKLAGQEVLLQVNCGEPLELIPKKRWISVYSQDNEYLGSIPEDLSFRLLRLIKCGNRYEVFAKGIDKQSLQVLIREIFRSKKLKNTPSFPSSGLNYIPYISSSAMEEEVLPSFPEETEEEG